MTLPEIVTVNVAALQLGHLPVIGGQVRVIKSIAADRRALSYHVPEVGEVRELPLDPSGVIGCVRRAQWSVTS